MSNNLAHAVKSEDKDVKILALAFNIAAAGAVGAVIANANLFTVALTAAGRYTITLKQKYLGTPRIYCHLQGQTAGAALASVAQANVYTANLGAVAPSTLEVQTLTSALAQGAPATACIMHVWLAFKDGIAA